MTTTYDPFHPKYFDEADLRGELTRVYDLCHGCRLCFKFCTSFPTLFAFVDAHDDQDAARLTPAQQDQVVDECFGCKLCYVNCPYIPGQSEWNLDFPRLMMRADQVRVHNGQLSAEARIQNQALARTDLVGRLNSAVAPLANKAIGTPGSFTRKVMEKTVGIASERVLPPYARQRFSTWFKKRTASLPRRRQGQVALFPTCLVEYQNPAIGRDLVKVYERNGIECSLPAGQVCCGAPWLHSGDVDHFVAEGRKNVTVLADAVRAGQRRRGAPADVRLHHQEGLRRLHRRPRRRTGGGQHLRRRRVPHEGAQGRATPSSTPTSPARSPRRSPTTPPATSGPRTSACAAAT